jgi:hypothetical protein
MEENMQVTRRSFLESLTAVLVAFRVPALAEKAPQATFLFGFDPQGNPVEVLQGHSSPQICFTAGKLLGWEAIAHQAPQGSNILFDLVRYRPEDGDHGRSMLYPLRSLIEVPRSEQPNRGDLNIDLQEGDLLWLECVYEGFPNPGKGVIINLF